MRRLIPLLLLPFLFAAAPAPPAAATLPVISHVVVVAMENHSRSQVIGTASAPYITSLAKTYGQATAYANVAHPSLPNYLDLIGGTNAGITTDCTPSSTCSTSGASVFSQLGTNWRSYQESMKTNCQKTNGSPYTAHHNPAAYYRVLTTCASQDVPLPATPDWSARLTFVTPNECHDMHSNTCPGSSNPVAQGDAWLKAWLPKLLASPTYTAGNTVVVLWWDENGSAGGALPFVVISPYTHGIVDTAAMNHYTLLRTIQGLLGVPCLQKSCQSASFAAAFGV